MQVGAVISGRSCVKLNERGGAVAQLGARLDGIEEVVGSNPIGSTSHNFAAESIFEVRVIQNLPGILQSLFGFVGEVEFGFFVDDERPNEPVRSTGTRNVDRYGKNTCHALLQTKYVC